MLNRQRLDELLSHATQNSNSDGAINNIHEFEETLRTALKDTASMPEWTLEHFLCIAVPLQTQCTLTDRLKEKRVIPGDYVPYILSNGARAQGCDLCVMPSIPSSDDILSDQKSIYVLVQEASGAIPSGLYFIDKRFGNVYISQITFLRDKGMASLIAAIFKESKDGVYSDIVNLSVEQLNEITLLTGHTLIEKGRIYFENKQNLIKYFVKLPSGEVVSDIIIQQELGYKFNQNFTDNDLNINFHEIMHITFRRGHTHLNIHNRGGYTLHYRYQNKPQDIPQAVTELLSDYDKNIVGFSIPR